MKNIKGSIDALSQLMPFDFAETSKRIRDMQHQQNRLWDEAVKQAKPHFAALKKYIRKRLQLGKCQWITFHGAGVVSIYKNGHRGLESVACIDATVATGIGGVELKIKWMPEDLVDLDRKIAAVRDALSAIRME